MGLAGCAAAGEPADALGGQASPIIYGTDDRLDVYEVEDEALRALAQWSVVALVPEKRLVRPATGGVSMAAPQLSEMKFATRDNQVLPLCAGERFLAQPTAADCTGVLIDDDLVLTAGHCIDNDAQCTDFAFVFDYFERAPGEMEQVNSSDLYSCRELLVRSVSAAGGGGQVDFAVVRLDRPALSRKPVKLRISALKKDEPLFSVGYPSGLPAKVDQGARVIDPRGAMGDYFLLNSDTFAGSSGSGIFDANRQLVGVLVRGGFDFVLSAESSECLVSSVVPDEGSEPHDWEEATYAKQVVDAVCDMGYPSQRLCGTKARCGDDFCSDDEDGESCAADCGDDRNKSNDEQVVGGPVIDESDAGEPPDEGVTKKKSASCSAGGTGSAGLAPFALTLLSLLALRRRRPRARREH
jgi:uncharacterized protein (TIGR03382 family)